MRARSSPFLVSAAEEKRLCLTSSQVSALRIQETSSWMARISTGRVWIWSSPGNISYMLQKDLLLPYRTIVDNVARPLIIRGEKKAAAREKASGYFEEFGLAGTEHKYPSQLSGGMKQRAALLRTYLFSEKVALLDEPFSALDMLTKSAVHEWYLDVMEKIKLSTLFITHDIDEAILLSDRIYLLTGKPGTLTKEIVIREPKPRRKDFNLSEEFLSYKREIIAHLGNR